MRATMFDTRRLQAFAAVSLSAAVAAAIYLLVRAFADDATAAQRVINVGVAMWVAFTIGFLTALEMSVRQMGRALEELDIDAPPADPAERAVLDRWNSSIEQRRTLFYSPVIASGVALVAAVVVALLSLVS